MPNKCVHLSPLFTSAHEIKSPVRKKSNHGNLTVTNSGQLLSAHRLVNGAACGWFVLWEKKRIVMTHRLCWCISEHFNSALDTSQPIPPTSSLEELWSKDRKIITNFYDIPYYRCFIIFLLCLLAAGEAVEPLPGQGVSEVPAIRKPSKETTWLGPKESAVRQHRQEMKTKMKTNKVEEVKPARPKQVRDITLDRFSYWNVGWKSLKWLNSMKCILSGTNLWLCSIAAAKSACCSPMTHVSFSIRALLPQLIRTISFFFLLSSTTK